MGAGFAQLAERSVVGVCIGILLKFMLGSDDLVWLSPFMAKASLATKVRMGYKYVGTVFVLTVIAVCVALGLTSAAGSDERVADEAFGTIAGTLMLAYSAYMAHDEGYFERCSPSVDDDEKKGGYGALDGGGDDDEEEGGPCTDRLAGCLLTCSSGIDRLCCVDPGAEPEAGGDAKHQRDVIVVAFLGSMDDFMVYFSIALSGKVTPCELVIGTTLGAVCIAFIVGVVLQASESIANCVEQIPVPAVLSALAVYIIVDAWYPLVSF